MLSIEEIKEIASSYKNEVELAAQREEDAKQIHQDVMDKVNLAFPQIIEELKEIQKVCTFNCSTTYFCSDESYYEVLISCLSIEVLFYQGLSCTCLYEDGQITDDEELLIDFVSCWKEIKETLLYDIKVSYESRIASIVKKSSKKYKKELLNKDKLESLQV